MKKIVYYAYAAGLIGVILFCCYLFTNVRTDLFQARVENGYSVVKHYEKNRIKDSEFPCGVQDVYTFRLNKLLKDGDESLIFYSKHQNVSVYSGDELIYERKAGSNNPFGKTPGDCWNIIPIYQSDNNFQIRIELTPVYDSVKDAEPEFYFGSRYYVVRKIVLEDAVQMVLSLTAMILGLIFILFTLYNIRNSEVDKSLIMTGLFSIHVGVWKFTDMDAFSLMLSNSSLVNYLPILSLLLVVVPFVLFVKEMFTLKEHILWYVLCIITFITAFLTIILQLLDIADIRESLWMTHAAMGLMVVVVLGMMAWEWHIAGWNKHLRLVVVCMGLCLFGLLSDLTLYYTSGGTAPMVLGMFGFIISIMILGALSIRETKKLMQVGMKARRYARMAYHDQLTGLYNRTAYAEDTGAKDFEPEHCIAVMFDLNNLKKCNDTQGHEQGDRYILCASEMIDNIFGNIGKCYRMGGDEFCVLLRGTALEECKKLIVQLKKKVEEHNERFPDEFPVQIACGYESYDKEVDYDFGDTLRRADKMMYREKFMMKAKASAQSTNAI